MPSHQNSEFTVPLENVKAVLFDLFDTLILISDNHECLTNSLLKLHSSLSKNGFLCDFSDFESSYVKVVEQIEAATATNLREPHFKIYVSHTLSNLGYRVSPDDKAIDWAFAIFAGNFPFMCRWILKR